LTAVLAALIGVFVYLLIKKYKSKPTQPTHTDTSQLSEEADGTPSTPDGGPEQDTTVEPDPDSEPNAKERVDA
jgi:hypothetical protein